MQFWREKWQEMNWVQRVLLVLMAAMVLGFGIATAVVVPRKGLAYSDALLYPVKSGEIRQYSGKVDGETALLTIRPGGVVEYSWGEYAYGPWQVKEDPTAMPADFWGKGIEIRQGEQLLFRGGYHPNSTLPLYQENGEPLWDIMVSATMSDGTVIGADGQELDLKEQHEPGLASIVCWAMEAEKLTHRGSFMLYLLVTLLAVLNVAQICFPGFFFRMSIRWHVKEPEKAEPSEFYTAMECLEWMLMTVVCLVLYWQALNVL